MPQMYTIQWQQKKFNIHLSNEHQTNKANSENQTQDLNAHKQTHPMEVGRDHICRHQDSQSYWEEKVHPSTLESDSNRITQTPSDEIETLKANPALGSPPWLICYVNSLLFCYLK